MVAAGEGLEQRHEAIEQEADKHPLSEDTASYDTDYDLEPTSREALDAGTVRKVGAEGYEREHHLAFFAGIAPASNPRLVAVVLINDPQSEEYGGGSIAAPVFSRVMSGALRLLNVPPDEFEKAA